MKNYFKYLGLLILALTAFVNCSEDNEIYDVDWPDPEITSVSTYNDFLSSTITLEGNFSKVENVFFGKVAGENINIAPDENSLTVMVPRTMEVTGAPIIVVNEFAQSAQTTQIFIPKVQQTSVLKVSEIQQGLTFTVEGDNVDLLTEISVDGKVVTVVSKTINSIILSVANMGLNAGQFVDVSFKSLAKNEIPTVKKVNVVYPSILYSEIILWDFEDSENLYSGEGESTIKSGEVFSKPEKYFSLRGPGYGWDKETGKLSLVDKPDFSKLVNPYLTMAVRTPAGSAGYFQMQFPGTWRHFGFGFDTGGEWIMISKPLDEDWNGDGWDPATFIPELSFKAGNAGLKQDVDIAFIKITEGQYNGSQVVGDVIGGSDKPSKIVVMDFEDTNQWRDILKDDKLVASLNLRTSDIEPFYGSGFFTYRDDGTLGDWGGYWGQTISRTMRNTQLSIFEDPYLSLAFNSIEGSPQYITVRVFQYDEKLEMVQKFFPNSNGSWETAQFSLFNATMENWSKTDTPLGEHYATLKTLNKTAPIDRIEIVINRNEGNTIGVSLDEIVITEGPRY